LSRRKRRGFNGKGRAVHLQRYLGSAAGSSCGVSKGDGQPVDIVKLAIVDKVANLARGGRLEGVKPISSLVVLCRAAIGLACAPMVKLKRGMAH
jgi:glutathione synthase/RimK-type ligase-like ATP-grasp enzyme